MRTSIALALATVLAFVGQTAFAQRTPTNPEEKAINEGKRPNDEIQRGVNPAEAQNRAQTNQAAQSADRPAQSGQQQTADQNRSNQARDGQQMTNQQQNANQHNN